MYNRRWGALGYSLTWLAMLLRWEGSRNELLAVALLSGAGSTCAAPANEGGVSTACIPLEQSLPCGTSSVAVHECDAKWQPERLTSLVVEQGSNGYSNSCKLEQEQRMSSKTKQCIVPSEAFQWRNAAARRFQNGFGCPKRNCHVAFSVSDASRWLAGSFG